MQARQALRSAQLSALFRVLPHDVALKVFRVVEDETRCDDRALLKLLKNQARIEVSELFGSLRVVGNMLAQRASEATGWDQFDGPRYGLRVQQLNAKTMSIRWPELARHERARLVGVPGVSISMNRYAIASVEDLEPGARLMFNCFARIFTRAHVASLRTPRWINDMWTRDGAAFLEEYAVPGIPTLHDVELPSLEQLREYLEEVDANLWNEFAGSDIDDEPLLD